MYCYLGYVMRHATDLRSQCQVGCLLISVHLALQGLVDTKQVATVRMLVRDQVQILRAGDNLEMACEFYMDGFDLFENPIIWKKTQSYEESRINIMSNIVEPFVGSGRFRVIFVQNPPRYKLQMNIDDISLEDYGNYTCEVRGTHTTVIAALTHHVFIKSPVRSIAISDFNRTITHVDVQRTLEYTEGDRCSLYCIGYGGCPPPDMTLYLGKHEITSQFSLDYTSDLSGRKGLRLIEHRTQRWTDRFKVTAEHDDQRLQCIVTVPGMGSNISTVKIKVKYAPIITCDKKYAFLGDKNVFLRCDVRARPHTTSLYWILDDRGTTLSHGRLEGEYWAIDMEDSNRDTISSRLYMKDAAPETFRSYTLVAENIIGRTTQQVTLRKKYQSSSSHQNMDKNSTNRDSTRGTYHHATTSSAHSWYMCRDGQQQHVQLLATYLLLSMLMTQFTHGHVLT